MNCHACKPRCTLPYELVGNKLWHKLCGRRSHVVKVQQVDMQR